MKFFLDVIRRPQPIPHIRYISKKLKVGTIFQKIFDFFSHTPVVAPCLQGI